MTALDLIPVPARWLMAVGLLMMAFLGGVKVENWRMTSHEAAAVKQQAADFQAEIARQNTIARDYEHDREQTRIEYRDREGAIRTVYKSIPAPSADCAAPDAVRGVLNEAVASANAPASESR